MNETSGARTLSMYPMPKHKRYIKWSPVRWVGGGLAVVLLIGGCSVTPMRTREQLPVQLPAHFTKTGGQQPIADHWWQDFSDPELTRLIETALSNNFSLRAAWARLRQANAVARREGAPLWPSIEARGSISRQGTSMENSVEQRQVELFTSYELDLWGRIRASSDAATFDAGASVADLQTSAITLTAGVANTWYQLVEQRAQLAVIDNQLATNRQLLSLIEARFRIGQATASDIYRQRQLVAQTEGDRTQVATLMQTLSHQLAILLGVVPGEETLPPDNTLPTLGPLPATGVPAELVRRRPDLQSAFLRLRAADARAAAAVSARYPRLNLTASATTPVGAMGGLFAGWLGNVVAQLTAPLFDGGRLSAEAQRTRAVVEENVNTYGQTLLEAIGEVEDALVTESGQRAYMTSLNAQLKQADGVVRQERQRYFQGNVDYLSVLDALRSRQSLERQEVTARRQLISDRIALVQALAGGWSMTPPAKERNN